ncbi:hypothetical protein [Novipirellula artificiosorum]|uniref:Uncharacterized protein n=1 Tax=Novipirellula artificiosorum TaxID=2528016 RepID=A0A5C6CFE7_9BACT|nr:hypothetical protein [Novipirellula artificiosorum]TWU22852.1 hypothetical protein Poly41_71140 [Novipirellula artificiosorum]
MIQVANFNESDYLNEPESTDDLSERIPRDKLITIRLTEDERESLNIRSQSHRISLNNFVRDKLGLPADTEPRERRRGRRPQFRKAR